MKKIKSLFKRDYENNSRLVYNELVDGSEWVENGEGWATIKWDGTCCLIQDGKLYRRYDRKLTKSAYLKKKNNSSFVPTVSDFKPAPIGWEAAEDAPNVHTGHWPGWLPVGNEPGSKWHREAWDRWDRYPGGEKEDGTWELIGEKINGNPHHIDGHQFVKHGESWLFYHMQSVPPRDFDGLSDWFADNEIEGVVWHHPDGRMVKIKRSDFGYDWPVK